MEHDLVQEHPIHQSHIFIQVGPISCSQRSKRFNLEQNDHQTRMPTSISAVTNNAARYITNNAHPSDQRAGHELLQKGSKNFVLHFTAHVFQKRNYHTHTHTNTPRELFTKRWSRNQWKSILAREENPIVEGRIELSLLKKYPRGKRAQIPRSGFDSSHEPQPALEMSVPGKEGQRKGIWRRRKGKGAGAARQKARQGCPAPGGARLAKLPIMN